MSSVLAITEVFIQQEVKGQSDTSLISCLPHLCCSLQVGDIVSVIDMPPKEDTTWWRGKHGFQVHSSQNTLQPGGKNTNAFALCVFSSGCKLLIRLYLRYFKGEERTSLCKAVFKNSEFAERQSKI